MATRSTCQMLNMIGHPDRKTRKAGAMTRTTKRVLSDFPLRQRGMAIGIILLACFLLGAISIALTLAQRGNITSAETQSQQVLASTILDQATAYNNAFDAYHAKNGCLVLWLALDTTMSSQCNLYDPATGTITPQTPPVDAFLSSANAHWVYKTDMTDGLDYGYPVVALKNVGTGQDSYVIVLVGLKQGVCQQINQKLLGTTTINAPSTSNMLSDWSTQTVFIDLSADNAVNGIYAQCIKTTDGGYVFYNVIWAQ